MTTSGVTALTLTARDAVTDCLRDLRVIGIDDTPSAAELAKGILALNLLLKSWQTRGAAIWRGLDVALTVTSASTVLDAGILDVISARAGTTERPLAKFNRADYLAIPNKSNPGSPSCFYVDRSDGVTLKVWPVPTSETIRLDCERIVETVTDGAETIDVPEKFLPCLLANLKIRLAAAFGAEVGQVDMMLAQSLEVAMFDHDREDYYSFNA